MVLIGEISNYKIVQQVKEEVEEKDEYDMMLEDSNTSLRDKLFEKYNNESNGTGDGPSTSNAKGAAKPKANGVAKPAGKKGKGSSAKVCRKRIKLMIGVINGI